MKKVDPNQIAALEKAVADKYGKAAVQDFRHEWDTKKEEEYLNQLKEKNKNQKKNKQAKSRKTDRTCPVCKTYSFSAKDDLYMNRFKCCHLCYIEHIAPTPTHKEKWQSGYRPSEEEVKHRLATRRKK